MLSFIDCLLITNYYLVTAMFLNVLQKIFDATLLATNKKGTLRNARPLHSTQHI